MASISLSILSRKSFCLLLAASSAFCASSAAISSAVFLVPPPPPPPPLLPVVVAVSLLFFLLLVADAAFAARPVNLLVALPPPPPFTVAVTSPLASTPILTPFKDIALFNRLASATSASVAVDFILIKPFVNDDGSNLVPAMFTKACVKTWMDARTCSVCPFRI